MKDRHYTDDELEILRRNAVWACAELELAKQFNAYLDAHGIERVSVESWSARLIHKMRKPLHGLPLFSVNEQ